MSLYFLQQRAEFVLFAVWNHLCFWRRRRLVCVVIHGWWNLLLDIFEGTWVSMAAVRFSWMHFHRESGSSFMLNFFKTYFSAPKKLLQDEIARLRARARYVIIP